MKQDQMTTMEIRDLLERKAAYYNQPEFVDNDPVSIPHQFTKKEDREISGFLASVISWGNRASIIKNASHLIDLMDRAPFEFVSHSSPTDLKRFEKFVHRTFNGSDCTFFIRALKQIYKKGMDMESVFHPYFKGQENPASAIHHFRKFLYTLPHEKRVEKHIGDPLRHSTAKRMCMFLRWMVRRDRCGVDLGIWQTILPSQLAIPLDVHTGRTARALGLLGRKSNDWKAVLELTGKLIAFDSADPVRYDYALFGLGIHENFN